MRIHVSSKDRVETVGGGAPPPLRSRFGERFSIAGKFRSSRGSGGKLPPPTASAAWFPLGSCLLALFACAVVSAAPAVVPTRATLEKHIDGDINVHGHFAAVRLPVTHGVPLWNPTAVKVADDGTVYVANYPGQIVRLVDSDGDGLEDTAVLFADIRRDGLRHATSLALRGKEVFVGTATEIRVYTDTDGDGVADQSRTFFKDFPCSNDTADWTFGLTFDRDGWLNFSLSTDSYNATPAPDPERLRGSLLKVSPDGTRMERVATGLRYPYGMAMNASGDLFFSDNSGGGNPTEEINWVRAGAFYGHNPDKFPGHPPATPPLVPVHYGYGMVGIAFNSPTNDFGGTAGDLFVASWGPDFLWERGAICRVHLERNPDGTYRAEEFPFAHEVPKLGDVAFGPQGDLYVAQFGHEGHGHTPYDKPSGGMYRFVYAPWHTPPTGHSPYPKIAGDLAHGKQVFTSLGCAACHSVGGKDELLGPDLEGIGDMFGEAEILLAIRNPSYAIKTGHEGMEITTRDGETTIGRVLRADEESLTMILGGNLRRVFPRADIRTNHVLAASLMPDGLLNAATPRDTEDLLAYLGVRRPTTWQQARIDGKRNFIHWRTTTSRAGKAGAIAALLAIPVVLVLFVRVWMRRKP